MSETHYVPAFTERVGQSEKAACGLFVRVHTSEPTCPQCRAWLESREQDGNPFETDRADPLMQPVKPSFAANSDAHYNERRR